MAHEAADFDTTLAAAAGDDLALMAELRAAFCDSLAHQIDLLGRARCDGNWEVAAQRLRSLGTSFHAPELVRLAELALGGAPGEPAVLRKLGALHERFAARRND